MGIVTSTLQLKTVRLRDDATCPRPGPWEVVDWDSDAGMTIKPVLPGLH